MKRLVFLGPPGAGKGTQAQVLAEAANIPHISTGEILREAIAENTPLGEKAKDYMDKGELVPDHLLLDLIRERLGQADAQNGWILDGFPRNVTQASFLHEMVCQDLKQSYQALYLEVPDSVLITRLLARGREDDNQEIIARRLEVYREQTEPVIDFYQNHNCLNRINGDRQMSEVTKSLEEIVS